MMTKFFYLYDRFFDSNRIFTTEHVKIVKISGFFAYFFLLQFKLHVANIQKTHSGKF